MKGLLRLLLWILTAACIIVALATPLVIFYKHKYPYGHSHCCILIVAHDLENYANGHNGHYPAGEESPEASLSLLHYMSGEYPLDAYTLRGKTVPVEIVEKILGSGGLLTPETCGWHYVPGLTKNDDRRLALLWDKAKLGHSGQITEWTEVIFVGGERGDVRVDQWEQFLEEQNKLLAARTPEEPVLTLKIRMPGGELVDSYSGRFEIEEIEKHADGVARSGMYLARTDLTWWGDSLPDGTKVWVLSLPDRKLRSKPLEIVVNKHRPSKPVAVFEMESSE